MLGQVAEWSIAAVLKTAECQSSVGSNPTLSAPLRRNELRKFLALLGNAKRPSFQIASNRFFSFLLCSVAWRARLSVWLKKTVIWCCRLP